MTQLRRGLIGMLVLMSVLGGAGLPGSAGAASASLPQFWFVCSSGCNFPDIQSAVNGVFSGDGIFIYPSTTPYAGFVDRTKNLDIENAGTDPVTISGGGPVITLGAQGASSQPTVSLQGLTITGGNTSPGHGGGGIVNYGTLTVTNSTIDGNRTTADIGGGFGGGILTWGALTVTGSVISNNSVDSSAQYTGYGGGIYDGSSSGNLTVTDSTITSNFSSQGAGIYTASSGALAIRTSTINGNNASSAGGIYGRGAVTVTDSSISGNTGGGVRAFGNVSVTNSNINNNSSNSGGEGGGISAGGSVSVTNSIISGNSGANDGGGISGIGVSVTNSTISDNNTGNARKGGGIENMSGDASVIDSTIDRNYAGIGGGIDNNGSLMLSNSTITLNDAVTGGGIYNESGGSLTLINSTVSGNGPSNSAGGIQNDNTGDKTSLSNTILAANTTTSGSSPDCSGSLSDGPGGHNLLGSSNGCLGLSLANHDLIDVANPGIGTLASNGGFTQTALPYPGSPAINAGDDATCATSPVKGVDQRGTVRPIGAHCDIGAVEFSLPIAKGWNLLDLPSQTGITSAAGLVSDLQHSTPGGAGGIKAVATYQSGRFALYVPGFSADLPLSPSQGIFVLSTAGGSWAPGGAPYGSSLRLSLHAGWNLVAAPLPQAGLEGSTIVSEISPGGNLQEVATYSGGSYHTYLPSVGGFFHVPSTGGMWIQVFLPATWTPS